MATDHVIVFLLRGFFDGNIFKIADKNNALIITTEKDYVKLSKSLKKKIYPINIKLHLSKKEKLLMELKDLVF